MPENTAPNPSNDPVETAWNPPKVEITHICYKGKVKGSQADEYVEITNQDQHSIDLSGWKVRSSSKKKQVFTFPAQTLLEAGQKIRVYTNEVHPETGGFSFGRNIAVWNDKGDEAQLLDHQDHLISALKYDDQGNFSVPTISNPKKKTSLHQNSKTLNKTKTSDSLDSKQTSTNEADEQAHQEQQDEPPSVSEQQPINLTQTKPEKALKEAIVAQQSSEIQEKNEILIDAPLLQAELETVQGGFNRSEAILMAQFCQRASELFNQYGNLLSDTQIIKVYNTKYRHEPWKLVYLFYNSQFTIRGLILKKENVNQYTVVFQGSTLTRKEPMDLTSFFNQFNPKLITTETLANPDCKVFEEQELTVNTIKDELSLFFKIIASRKIQREDWQSLNTQSSDKKRGLETALLASSEIILGSEFEKNLQTKLEENLTNDTQLTQQLSSEFNSDTQETSFVNSPLEIFITGHGVGGAMGSIFTLVLHNLLSSISESHFRLKVYTFGACQNGNQAFIQAYNSQIGKEFHYNIENSFDPMIYLPVLPSFPFNFLSQGALEHQDSNLSGVGKVGTGYALSGFGKIPVSLAVNQEIPVPLKISFPYSCKTYLQLLETDEDNVVKSSSCSQSDSTKASKMASPIQMDIQDLLQEVRGLKSELQDLNQSEL